MEEYQRALEGKFKKLLIEIGYPSESIIYRPSPMKVRHMLFYVPSFLIVDPVNKERLALIEVKEAKIGEGRFIYENLHDYRKALGNEKIRLYVVGSPTEGTTADFSIYTYDADGKLGLIDFSLFPVFQALSADDSAGRKDSLRKKETSATKSFQKASLGLAAFLLGIAIMDVVFVRYGIVLLTTERLALLGVSVALVIMPYIQKFKWMGLEFEKAISDENK